MFNVLPYVPFINYRKKWINDKLNLIKSKRNNQMFKDKDGDVIDWSVVEYTLCLYYNQKYFNSLDTYIGLRLNLHQLIPYLEN